MGSLHIKVPFDVPTWTSHINTSDPLAFVIRGHLYVEAALVQQIEAALANKEGLVTARLSFMLKVSRRGARPQKARAIAGSKAETQALAARLEYAGHIEREGIRLKLTNGRP